MTDQADVIVVGAGIHGASTAFHLAERGVKVIILDRSAAGAAATGRSSGVVRMHYDLAAESALAWLSYGYFRDWADRVGGDCGFVRTGFLRIVPQAWEAALRANVEDQVRIGIPTSVVSAAEVARLAPGVIGDDFGFAAFEPESGYADPAGACAALLAGARRWGAELRQGVAVEAITVDGDRVTGVRTATGSIAASTVVLAAGAWSGPLAATCGVELAVRAWHHDTGFVTRPPAVAVGLPTVIDDINEIYFRPEGERLALVGLEDGNRVDDQPDDDSRSDPDFIDHAVDRLCNRAPAFVDAELHSAHGGTDGISPDQRPIIGRDGPDGLVLQAGFSGTGFKIAPAVGLAVSELVVDGEAHSADISAFEPGRFTAGRPLAGDHPYGAMWR